ncbi:hypothetical protein LTS17_012171 [Exophiala oligosperma]
MSVGSDSQSSSQHLSSSQASLNQSSKRTTSEISKIYKHASQLFLTRRLLEAYDALQPIVTPPGNKRPDDSPAQAPVATATTSQRIKIWSLYVTLLNSIVDLGYEEGANIFGPKPYSDIVRNVRNGNIWDQVIKDGYQGREGSVDAEVVYNLSNLLLGQAPDQKTNQSRLETYLSSSQNDLDFSTHLSNALSNGRQPGMNGTNTPKDLASRIKVLELFTLHVLPRNEEWDYAKSFISNSDFLDEERREAFMQTLQELQEASEGRDNVGEAEDEEEDEEVFEDTEEDAHSHETTPLEQSQLREQTQVQSKPTSKHQRTSSEVDYGIEKEHPNGTHITTASTTAQGGKLPKDAPPMTKIPPQPMPSSSSPPRHQPAPPAASSGRSTMSPPSSQTPRRSTRKPKATMQNAMLAQARLLFSALSNLARNLAGTISKNPTNILRMLLFILAFIMAFSQRHIREKARSLANTSWNKVRATIGMGTKVSYI